MTAEAAAALPGQAGGASARTAGPTPRSHEQRANAAGSERGRTRVAPKALERVVTAVAAGALGVAPSKVGVTLSDRNGLLAIAVSGPISVVALASVRGDDNSVLRSGGTVLDRAEQAGQLVRTQVLQLTGSVVGSVTIRLTGAEIAHEKRVK